VSVDNKWFWTLSIHTYLAAKQKIRTKKTARISVGGSYVDAWYSEQGL